MATIKVTPFAARKELERRALNNIPGNSRKEVGKTSTAKAASRLGGAELRKIAAGEVVTPEPKVTPKASKNLTKPQVSEATLRARAAFDHAFKTEGKRAAFRAYRDVMVAASNGSAS